MKANKTWEEDAKVSEKHQLVNGRVVEKKCIKCAHKFDSQYNYCPFCGYASTDMAEILDLLEEITEEKDRLKSLLPSSHSWVYALQRKRLIDRNDKEIIPRILRDIETIYESAPKDITSYIVNLVILLVEEIESKQRREDGPPERVHRYNKGETFPTFSSAELNGQRNLSSMEKIIKERFVPEERSKIPGKKKIWEILEETFTTEYNQKGKSKIKHFGKYRFYLVPEFYYSKINNTRSHLFYFRSLKGLIDPAEWAKTDIFKMAFDISLLKKIRIIAIIRFEIENIFSIFSFSEESNNEEKS